MPSRGALIAVGYWQSDWFDELPDPRALVDPLWELERRWRVVDYLRTGAVLLDYLGYSFCRFRGGPPDERMGSADLTDGTYLWPEALWIYVERYHVVLPPDFVAHMERQAFLVPAAEELDPSARPWDFQPWIRWAKAEGCSRSRARRLAEALLEPLRRLQRQRIARREARG